VNDDLARAKRLLWHFTTELPQQGTGMALAEAPPLEARKNMQPVVFGREQAHLWC